MYCEVPFHLLSLVFYCRVQVKIWYIILHYLQSVNGHPEYPNLIASQSQRKRSSPYPYPISWIPESIPQKLAVENSLPQGSKGTVSRPFHEKVRIGCSDLWKKGKYFTPWNTNSIGFKTIQNDSKPATSRCLGDIFFVVWRVAILATE